MKKLWIAAILFLTAAAVSAQDDAIRVATNLVTLNVSVSDKKGKTAQGLTRADFKLTDDGKPQEIDSFSDAGAPISFGIVYDQHPATAEQTLSVLDALKQFAGRLGQSDDFFVTVFNEKGSLTTEFIPTPDQITKQAASGATSLFDAIFAASGRMAAARNHKRVLLVLTDGADHRSQHSLKELKNHLRSINLPVYAITFSNNDRRLFSYADLYGNGRRETIRYGEANDLDRGAVAEISKTSGGHTYDGNMRNRVYLSAIFGKVRDEIKGQYVIGFYPEKLDGKYHKLKVTVAGQTQKKLKVSNRKGYVSPKRGEN